MVGFFIGLLCGAIVPFAVQAWAFHEQEKKERAKLKAFLLILSGDLKEYFEKLFVGERQYYYADPYNLLSNFREFNTANKHAMWPELMKFDIFHSNLEIFGRINSIIHKIEAFNGKMRICIPEKHTITSSSIEVHNWRDIMDEIKNLYALPKGENTPYENSTVGNFLLKAIQKL
jgi:hypothetical protein